MLDAEFDRKYSLEYCPVCGTDEAGRGPLAGPVAAAAVVLPEGCVIEGLDDSKKLRKEKRKAVLGDMRKGCGLRYRAVLAGGN